MARKTKLPDKVQKGDLIKAEHISVLAKLLKGGTLTREALAGLLTTVGVYNEGAEIPSNSVFGFKSPHDFDPPVFKAGQLKDCMPLGWYTNGDLPLLSQSNLTVKPITALSSHWLRVDLTDNPPDKGEICGPHPEHGYLSNMYCGFIAMTDPAKRNNQDQISAVAITHVDNLLVRMESDVDAPTDPPTLSSERFDSTAMWSETLNGLAEFAKKVPVRTLCEESFTTGDYAVAVPVLGHGYVVVRNCKLPEGSGNGSSDPVDCSVVSGIFPGPVVQATENFTFPAFDENGSCVRVGAKPEC